MILKTIQGILFLILLFCYSIISLYGQTLRLSDPFDLSEVKLFPSRFTENQERDLAYLNLIDADRMLFSWRQNYGLSTGTSTAVGGWEGASHELRGHSLGHLLIALAQAYAGTGEVKYKIKADYIVDELKKCQDRAVSRGFTAGYLSAFPESYVNNLLAAQHSWAPLYCIHKTFAGLLECFNLCGNTTALTIAISMGDWTYNKLKVYNHTQLQGLWNNMDWNAGEYGGFNESLAILYSITKNPDHLSAAKYFDHDALFTPCLNNQDQLNGMHANTQIPKIIGSLKIYEDNGEANYFSIAKNFFNIVTTSHTYVTGGNSKGERFGSPEIIAGRLGGDNTETCNSYNMLKLAMYLFMNEPDARYMDFYENTLYNHILGSQDPTVNSNHVTYFVPLNAGGTKTYSDDYNTFTCCHGTGMENQTKYNAAIYFHKNNILWLNLFIASELSWTEKNFVIRQETKFPDEQNSKLTIIKGNGQFALKIRVPYWAKNGLTLFVNGIQQNVTTAPGSYATLDRMWTQGDVILINIPFLFRIEYTPDVSNMGGIKYGPILLAGQNINSMPTLKLSSSNLSSSFAPSANTLEFTSNGITFKPFYNTHHINYSIYFYTNPIIPEQGCTKTPQTITIPAIPDKIISDAPFNISASSSSSLPVSLTISSGPASILNKTITLKGTVGIVTVKANQAGDTTYCSASQLTQTFHVYDPNDKTIIWHFENSLENWTLTKNYTGSANASILSLSITGADPFMHSPDIINAVAASYPYIIIKAKNSTASSDAKIYFVTTSATGYDEAKSVPFIIKANDNGYSEYVVNMSANSGWTGTIKQIRLDMPQSGSSGVIEIDYIALNNSGVLTSIKKNDDSNHSNIINIYPNPIKGNGFYIEFDQNKPTSENYIELLNLQGQIIERHQLSGNPKEFILLDHLNSSGIYFLRFTNPTNTIYKKIIVL